mgnify:CR=1 FL=1
MENPSFGFSHEDITARLDELSVVSGDLRLLVDVTRSDKRCVNTAHVGAVYRLNLESSAKSSASKA